MASWPGGRLPCSIQSNSLTALFTKPLAHGLVDIAKSAIVENNSLTMGEQKNAIENFYYLLLTEFRHMASYFALSNQILKDICIMRFDWLQKVTGHQAMMMPWLRETAYYYPMH